MIRVIPQRVTLVNHAGGTVLNFAAWQRHMPGLLRQSSPPRPAPGERRAHRLSTKNRKTSASNVLIFKRMDLILGIWIVKQLRSRMRVAGIGQADRAVIYGQNACHSSRP